MHTCMDVCSDAPKWSLLQTIGQLVSHLIGKKNMRFNLFADSAVLLSSHVALRVHVSLFLFNMKKSKNKLDLVAYELFSKLL